MSGNAKQAASAGAGGKRNVVMGAIAGVCMLATGALLYSNITGTPREGILPDEPGAAPAQPAIALDPEEYDDEEVEEILERTDGEMFAEDYTVRLDPEKPSAIPGPGGKMPGTQYDSPE